MKARRRTAVIAILTAVAPSMGVAPTSALMLPDGPDPTGSPWKGSATTTDVFSGETSSMLVGSLYPAEGVEGEVGWESWTCDYVRTTRVTTTGPLMDFAHSSTMVQWTVPALVEAEYSLSCDGSYEFDPLGEDPPRSCGASVGASLVASGPAAEGLSILYLRDIRNWSSEALLGEVSWSIDNFSDSCGVTAIEVLTEVVAHGDGDMSGTLTAEHLRSGAVLEGIDLGEYQGVTWTESWRYEYDGCSLNADAKCETIQWRVLPRMDDDNGDGILDNRYVEGRLSDPLEAFQQVDVVLDACPGTGVSWLVDGATQQAGGACRIVVPLPEGEHTVSASSPGAGTSTVVIDPKHLMIVGLGDSYGSGEGVPNLVRRDGHRVAQWDQKSCHRSRYSAQAQAALRLEKADEHSAVTFLHLACSGATTFKGVLDEYPDPPGGGSQEPQVVEASEITISNPVDAVLLSLGGNDIGFAAIIQECILQGECPTHKKLGKTLHKRTQNNLINAEVGHDTANACLTMTNYEACPAPTWLHVPSDRVYLTEYPSLGRDSRGNYCDVVMSGFEADELRWATEVVQEGRPGTTWRYKGRDLGIENPGLNRLIRSLDSVPGHFTPVKGVFNASRKHGYCARDPWVVKFRESYDTQGDKFGTMHPNRSGQKAYGRIIANTIVKDLT